MGMTPALAAIDWHDQIAADFEEAYYRSSAFQERLEVWHQLIRKYVTSGHAVLDAGCGPGFMTMEASKIAATVTALDGSEQMIARCKARLAPTSHNKNVQFVHATLEALDDWPAETFDVILCSSVLEYVEPIGLQVDRLARMLKPNGVLIVSMPNRSSPYRLAERIFYTLFRRPRYYAHVINVLALEDMKAIVLQAGLEPTEAHFYAKPPILRPLWRLVARPGRDRLLYALVAHKPGQSY
jgi:2-polyprenyl-3-methyl-5-hydroxy-6-metoxy-1,4-benzoquinol methylase